MRVASCEYIEFELEEINSAEGTTFKSILKGSVSKVSNDSYSISLEAKTSSSAFFNLFTFSSNTWSIQAKTARLKNENHAAEPGATANELHCHGLCSEQHTPRHRSSSLSLNVRQKL